MVLFFDVFGTCVDWRSGVARDVAAVAPGLDAGAFADVWRSRYQPSLEEVRSGRRPFTKLDVLHRESLEALLAEFGVEGLPEERRSWLNLAWHRLDPWPDVAPGLLRLRERHITATLSNGNVRLLVDLVRHGGLRFDAILSAEVVEAYKPQPEAYLRACELLDTAPSGAMLVAAHPDDLAAAAAVGLGTAYVARPEEWGRPGDHTMPEPGSVGSQVSSFVELAEVL